MAVPPKRDEHFDLSLDAINAGTPQLAAPDVF